MISRREKFEKEVDKSVDVFEKGNDVLKSKLDAFFKTQEKFVKQSDELDSFANRYVMDEKDSILEKAKKAFRSLKDFGSLSKPIEKFFEMSSEKDQLGVSRVDLLSGLSKKLTEFKIDVEGEFSNTDSLKTFQKYFSSVQSVIDKGLKMNALTGIDDAKKSIDSLGTDCKSALSKFKSESMKSYDKQVSDDSANKTRKLYELDSTYLSLGPDLAEKTYQTKMNLLLRDGNMTVKEAENATARYMLEDKRFSIVDVKSAFAKKSPNCAAEGYSAASKFIDGVKDKMDKENKLEPMTRIETKELKVSRNDKSNTL